MTCIWVILLVVILFIALYGVYLTTIGKEQTYDVSSVSVTQSRQEEGNDLFVARIEPTAPTVSYRYEEKPEYEHEIVLTDKYVAIDIEHTGGRHPAVTEVAAIRMKGGSIQEKFSTLVNPGTEAANDYLPFIQRKTGITTDMLKEGRDIEVVLEELLSFIGDSVLVGHNVHTDIKIIDDNVHPEIKDLENRFTDTMYLAQRLIPLCSYSLETVAAYFDIRMSERHRAEADCYTTCLCYEQLKELALEKYGSEESLKKKWSRLPTLKAKYCPPTEPDKASPLYGKVCVFTGHPSALVRADAEAAVAAIGGIVGERITKKTDYLFVGVEAGKGKLRKAQEYLEKYPDIGLQILSGTDFVGMLENKIGAKL
jgi:DNA polymerase-3 subunit epsilon